MTIDLALAALGVVIVASALAAGLVDRAPLSFPLLFVGLGALAGPRGLGLLSVDAHSAVLEALAIVTLSLMLFLDAVNLERTQERRDLVVPLLVLGPGTLLVVALLAAAAALLLGLPPRFALLTGAILGSTDPVLLREVTRNGGIPGAIRRVLTIEAGTNDVVVLPIVLVVLASAAGPLADAGPRAWLDFLARLLLVGPLLGFAIGGLGAWLMTRMDARIPIRREYQALYGIGLVLGAYGAGATIGVDGFLAAFFAGLGVTLLNQSLCDCFLEYGQATAEMGMLLTFSFFGALLSSLAGLVPLGPALALAAIAIFVVRPLAVLLVMSRARSLSWPARVLIAWFGPRGLASLLFALLAVRAGLPEGANLLAIVGTVVLASIVLHGASGQPLAAWYARVVARRTLGEERAGDATGLFEPEGADVRRVSAEELAAMVAGPAPPLIVDVRSRSEHARDPRRIPGAIRVPADEIVEWARGRPVPGQVILYCT